MTRPIVELDGKSLSIEDFITATRGDSFITVSNEAIEQITLAAEIVEDMTKQGRQIYGITTGFGFLQDVRVPPKDIQKLQENLIVSHSAGVGSEFPDEIVRGMMILQVNNFARGHSGIRAHIVSLLTELVNKRVIPIVPSKGSLGASGDLAPLAHLSSVLIGKGYAYYNGKRMSGSAALRKVGLNPVKLGAKEGLALLNGTQAMTSIAAFAVADSEYLVEIANLTTAMNMEVHRANIDALNPLIHEARPHNGQIKIAKTILNYLDGSKRIRKNVDRQDCYSIRCVPTVHGATSDTINHVKKVIEIEMNSSTDNPLVFCNNQILSGGNFHGQPIALAMDFLSIALAEIGSISERRIERLLNPTLSGLPPFLAPNSGLNSGFMIAQYTAASLVSENKGLAFEPKPLFIVIYLNGCFFK